MEDKRNEERDCISNSRLKDVVSEHNVHSAKVGSVVVLKIIRFNMEDKRNEERDCISDSRLKDVVSEHDVHSAEDNGEFLYKQLFEKELTPSDVKNNRFVIPRKYATKFFSQVQQNEEMSFYDTSNTKWKFRFFYCKSSKKCTFTRGWPKFVKTKGLKAKDVIVFNMCESKNGANEFCNAFVIDVVKNDEVLPMNHPPQEEMEAQSIDHEDEDALTPILLFGKQIGWSNTEKENES